MLSRHAQDEMRADNLATGDVLCVLRGGEITEPAELENGSWRYRVHTRRLCVVVAFERDENDELLVVVTVWRKGGKA
jgi:hypothetical protein